MTANDVMWTVLRCRYRYLQDLCIPRCCQLGHEADLLVIRKSGWAEEVEIKVSVSDFRAEWKKKADKHDDLQNGVCTQVGYAAGPWGNSGPRAYWGRELPPEDQRITRGAYIYVRDQLSPIRRFWFAMPEALAEKLLPEVPECYGVLAVNSHVRELRPASILKPARKVTDAERLKCLNSTYSRYWQMLARGHQRGTADGELLGRVTERHEVDPFPLEEE